LLYANAEDVKKLLEDFSASIQVDKSGNKLLIITTPKIITDIERVVKSIDQPALQITLSARLIEVSVEDEDRLGINWSKLATATGQFFHEGSSNPGLESASAVDALSQRSRQFNPFEYINDINTVGHMWRSGSVYEIALDWILKNSSAEVLTNTSISTMNASTATIELVDIVPYVTSAGGVGGQVSVQREEVGIKLSITPQVNKDRFITVTISPEVSSIFEFIGPDQTIPRVVRRASSTTIRVRDGESVVVGGLMGITTLKTVHKVPFFGDVPYVGGLFRYNVVSSKKTDLIIEVTPHILDDPKMEAIKKSAEILDTEKRYWNEMNPSTPPPEVIVE
jgi:type IV pilus assembly protein PilQ